MPWPDANTTPTLVDEQGNTLMQLPTQRPTSLLHKRQWWNMIIANPSGFIEPESRIEQLVITLPEREIIPFGPDWLRGWLPTFLIVLIVFSLVFKWRWRLS